MLSIKQQRLQKQPKEITRRQKVHDFEIPNNVHEVISATIRNTDRIEELLKKDMIGQILNDEFNQINFYEIYSKADPTVANIKPITTKTNSTLKLPRVINFHSVNSMQDLATLKNTKLYSKRKVGKYAKNLRESLKKEQDKQLLLSEIYELLDHHRGQNDDSASRNTNRRSSLEGKQQITIDQQSVNELTNWSKNHQQMVPITLNVLLLLKKNQTQKSFQIVKPTINVIGSLREIPPVKSMRRINISHRTSIYQKTIDTPGSIIIDSDDQVVDSNYVSPNNQKGIKLKERIFGAFKRVQAEFQQEHTDQLLLNSGNDTLSPGTSKKIQIYLNQKHDNMNIIGENQISPDERLETNQNVVFDYSAEGLLKTLNKLIRVNAISFNNEQEKAMFYQKQSCLGIQKNNKFKVMKKINLKFKQHKTFVEKQQQTVDMLRIETHDINEKLTQIKQLIKLILLEIAGIKEEDSKTNQSKTIKNINESTDSPAKSRTEKNNFSFVSIVVQVSNKMRELDNDCQLLKESQENYREKLKFNKLTLERLDKGIVQKKKDDKKLKKALISLYLFILSDGQDFRQTGLAWLLQNLWQMDEKVYDKNLPNFLDQKAKEFIFMKARRLQELCDMKDQQASYFKNYQQQVQGTLDSSLSIMLKNISMNVSLQDLLYNDGASILSNDSKKFGSINLKQARQEYSNKLTKQISYDDLYDLTRGMRSEDKYAVENLVSVLNQQVNVTPNDLLYLETKKKLKQIFKIPNNSSQQVITEIDVTLQSQSQSREIAIQLYDQIAKQIELVQDQLKKLEEEELTRIIKEFDFKQYGRRYSIDPAAVLSCLFGASRSDKELLKNGLKKRHELE